MDKIVPPAPSDPKRPQGRFRSFLIALGFTYALCVVLGVWFAGRMENEQSGAYHFLAVIVASLLCFSLGAYFLGIIYWARIADRPWSYIWRGYVLFAGSNVISILVVAALDIEFASMQGLVLYLIAPWPIVWLWLRNATENIGRYN